MRLHEYQKAAMRTMSPQQETTLTSRTQQLVHCCLGIAGELGEIITSQDRHNTIEEIGDFMWYLAGTAHALGIDLDNIDLGYKISEEPFDDLTTNVAIIADKIKRHIYYKVTLDVEVIERAVGNCIVCLEDLSAENGVTLEECMITNIDKLSVRYPDKFDEGKAVRRNTHKELESVREL